MDEILRDTIIGEATREIPKGSHHTREMRRQLLTIIINYLVDETRYEIKKLYWDGILSMDKIKKFGDLHDYIDANCLASVCEDCIYNWLKTTEKYLADGLGDYLIRIKGANAWVKDLELDVENLGICGAVQEVIHNEIVANRNYEYADDTRMFI